VLAPPIGCGLAQGDRVRCIAEDGVAQLIVAHLPNAGLDAAPYPARRQLIPHSAAEATPYQVYPPQDDRGADDTSHGGQPD
jgi:hypothetical protein